MNVTENHITALYKLLRHSGLRFRQAISLKQSDFDLNKKIIENSNMKFNKTYRFTIYPEDVSFFKIWFKTFKGELFPFTPITLILHMRKFGGSHALRKELADSYNKLGLEYDLLCLKLGLHIEDPDHELDMAKMFKQLQKWELQKFTEVMEN